MKRTLTCFFPASTKSNSGCNIQKLYGSLCFIWIMVFPGGLCAQEIVQPQHCDSTAFLYQIDSIKTLHKNTGFLLLRETSLKMESQYEMPVMVPLRANEWYNFTFLGEAGSSLLEVRVFDADENKVYFEKKVAGDEHGNIISFTFIPQKSTYYLIRPLQKNKYKKKLCAYMMLFRKTALP